MDTFDKFINNSIQNDHIDLDLDNSSYNQLHYMVNMNSTKSKVKMNSIFGIFSDFISPKFIVAKLAFVAVLFILIIGNKQNHVQKSFNFLCDSTYTNNANDTIEAYNNQLSDSLFN